MTAATAQRTNAAAKAAPLRAAKSSASASRAGTGFAGRTPAGERKLGNQATQTLLLDGLIQARLNVNSPGDPLEREADAVADRVMAGGTSGGVRVQRKCAACEQEDLQLKAERDSHSQLDDALASQIVSLRGGGMPLAESTRNYFEPRFGHDFSAVRIHADTRAAETASSINALAYTRGPDIVFARGQYQPDNLQGKRLLAHELTHVVQQGAGAVRKPAADTVQRACGAEIEEVGGGCETMTGGPLPPGELVLFRVNCDTYASPAESSKVRNFADSMLATDRVIVHGFASMDGDPGFNHRIACARAKRAAATLEFNGIEFEKIDVVEHGPTEGPADERRSVILELEAHETRLPTPQLRVSPLGDPLVGNCADFSFDVFWEISRNSHPENGGFVIQDLTITTVDVDCAGSPVPLGYESPIRYFEAWRVEPGSKNFDAVDTQFDTFSAARGSGSGCATGSTHYEGVATYFDNVLDLPPDMIRNNPDTLAGTLRSSLLDPELDGVASRPVTHRLTASWNCCPCGAPTPTLIESHTP